MNEEMIARINTLYHKSKAEGLTPEEKEEQQMLRKQYIEAIKSNMRATLDHTSIKNQDGTVTPLKIIRAKNLAVKQDKKEIRKLINEKRNALSKEEVVNRSEVICKYIIDSDHYKNSENICVYEAFRNEVSCDTIINKAYNDNKQVFVPVVNMNSKTMEFFEINSETKWRENEYGIKEPVITDDTNKLDNSLNALIIMPGIAFDSKKHRIGYGGGYYDKFLSNNNNHVTIALCYDFQIIDTDIPYNEHDIKPEFIATDKGIL